MPNIVYKMLATKKRKVSNDALIFTSRIGEKIKEVSNFSKSSVNTYVNNLDKGVFMIKEIISQISNRWGGDNPVVMRSQLVEFSCGLISSIQTIKNLETRHPNIIKGKFTFGKRKVGYPTEAVIEFLETRLREGQGEENE